MHKILFSLSLLGVAAVAAALPPPLSAAPPALAPSPAYMWKNVAIGGGGYVLDVVCHPKEKDLVYIRTDVGGFYRWDARGEGWTPITDAFGRDQSNYYGGEGLALDPSDPDVVYIAAGKYVADWAPKGAIFKSSDRGRTWKKLSLELKMGGNEHYRVCGQRLVVSPSDPKLLLFGSRGDGLWRSGDGGETWARAGAFAGRAAVGITSVAFAADEPGVVFAASFGEGVYRSSDGGATWTKTPDGPAEVLRLAAAPGGVLFATHEKGVAKWEDGKWADVTPPGAAGAYAGLSVNPRDPRDVITAGQKDSLHLFRSRDGGATWERKRTETDSSVPWYPGHMKQIQFTSGLTFDPQVPGRVWLTDWYATYRGSLDADPVVLQSREEGHEEVVVFSLAAPAAGLPLVSGVADVDGFPHASLDAFPARGLGAYYGGSGTSWGDCYQVAFCPTEPLHLARVGGRRWDNTGGGSVSADGGRTWSDFPTWDNKVVPARIALSAADPKNLVVLRLGPGPALVTHDAGKTWKASAGLPDNLVPGQWNWQVPLAADGARRGVFYAFTGGAVYRSVDGGATFAVVAKGLPSEGQSAVVTVPGRDGEVWLSLDGGGLRRSTDGGVTFTALPAVERLHLFAVGKAAPGKSEPALYLYGTLAGGRPDGIFRSLDHGKTWEAIQDPRVPVGNEPNSIAASFQTFGRVFIGTNGRGIYYGEPVPARKVEAKN